MRVENWHPTSNYVVLALLLTLLALLLFSLGFAAESDSLLRALLHAVAGAVLTLGWVELLHEWFVARQVRSEFRILGDFIERGVTRLCPADEADGIGREALEKTHRLSILGIGISWLVQNEARRTHLEGRLARGLRARVLIPDPSSREIQERYHRDEPAERYELGLSGLAGRAQFWFDLSERFETLEVRLYHRYPVATVMLTDRQILMTPVLFRQRAKEGMTAVFRRPSEGASPYELHFEAVWRDGSDPLDHESLTRIELAKQQNWRPAA